MQWRETDPSHQPSEGRRWEPLLSPILQAWLAHTRAWTPRSAEEREAARELSDHLFTTFGHQNADAVTRIQHTIRVDDRDIRIDEYRPSGCEGSIPGYLSLHGGAFRLGSIDELINVALCSRRAIDAGVAVFTVNYRLAPEFPFPAALEDALGALAWLVDSSSVLDIDARSIVVGGVSAGGNLAVGVSRMARIWGLPVCGQLLEVPVLDLRDNGLWAQDYADLNGFTSIADLRGAYATAAESSAPLLSPAIADIEGLPPTHVMIAEYDPLRGAAELFVERLRAAGHPTTATMHLGELHGSHGLLRDSRAARLWHAEVVAVLRELTSAVL